MRHDTFMIFAGRLLAIVVVMTLAIAMTSLLSQAGESTLISVGIRGGFSNKTPLLGKQQREEFRMYDGAAIFRLPWRWPLDAGKWKLETGLLTSVGLLEAAGDAGVMATVVPELILTGWNEIVSFDAGAGAALFSRHQFGSQNFGGPAQFIASLGVMFSPFTHSYAGFHLLHFSDAGLYGSDSLGVDLYVFEIGYKF
jgi:Lipid A 3-O-deacylase (PagL)